jgi:hypothetical protein
MDSGSLIVVELVLVLGLALGWGFWELLSLRRDKRRADAEKRAAKDDPLAPD